MTVERDFILLMYNDATTPLTPEIWPIYLESLRTRGVFDGGSAIGSGETFRRDGETHEIGNLLGGYIRVRAPTWQRRANCWRVTQCSSAAAPSRSGSCRVIEPRWIP